MRHPRTPSSRTRTTTPAIRAWEDVTDDGHVTIDGREYAVRPEVVAALADNRPYYNAGVVGPDGFPDLTYAAIHPEQTGKWLRHILKKAWQAQDDASYTDRRSVTVRTFSDGDQAALEVADTESGFRATSSRTSSSDSGTRRSPARAPAAAQASAWRSFASSCARTTDAST